MLPPLAHRKIRYATIHYREKCVEGFSFFDSRGEPIWEILATDSKCNVVQVTIAETEVIIGVACKLNADSRTISDF
mgnify:CR=1 FL=1